MFACCAFAVFLLNQLLFPFVSIFRRVTGRLPDTLSASALWQPGMAPLPALGRAKWRPAYGIVLAAELLMLVSAITVAALVTGFGDKAQAQSRFIPDDLPFCGDNKGVAQ